MGRAGPLSELPPGPDPPKANTRPDRTRRSTSRAETIVYHAIGALAVPFDLSLLVRSLWKLHHRSVEEVTIRSRCRSLAPTGPVAPDRYAARGLISGCPRPRDRPSSGRAYVACRMNIIYATEPCGSWKACCKQRSKAVSIWDRSNTWTRSARRPFSHARISANC